MPTLKELKKFCKASDRDGLFARIFTRPFAKYFTWFFLNIRWRAEQVCFLWVLMGVTSAFFYMAGNYYLALVGLLVFNIAMILDCSDGEVARYTKKCTLRGPYLDLLGHQLVNPLILVSIGIYSYKNPIFNLNPLVFLFAGIIAAIFIINVNLTRLKVYEVLADNKIPIAKERERMKQVPKYDWKNWKILVREQARVSPGSLFYWATIFNFLPLFILFEAVVAPSFYLYRAFREFKYLEKNYHRKA